MRGKWLLGAMLALSAAGYATAQDSNDNKQPPPTPAQNDNRTPPPAPTNDQTPARTDGQTSPSNENRTTTPPTPGTEIHASGQVNAPGAHISGQVQGQTDRVGVQTDARLQSGQQVQGTQQFQTGQRTQFDQQGVAAQGQLRTGQVQSGVVQDRWTWPGQVQGQVQGQTTQGAWVQNAQGQWVQQVPGQQIQGWAQPGYSQQGYSQGYVQGQYTGQPGYVQGQTYGGVQGQYPGQAPMDQSASMNFHRAKQVMGARVSIEGGLSVGVVEDIVFSDQGQIEFVVVANEGKLVSVPWSAAKFNFEQRQATVAINQEQFQQIPTFTASNYPTFSDPGYRTQIYGFYSRPGVYERSGYLNGTNWNGGNWVTPRQGRQMNRGRR